MPSSLQAVIHALEPSCAPPSPSAVVQALDPKACASPLLVWRHSGLLAPADVHVMYVCTHDS